MTQNKCLLAAICLLLVASFDAEAQVAWKATDLGTLGGPMSTG